MASEHLSYVRAFQLAIVAASPLGKALSESRTYKLSPTHRHSLFTVRHRLRRNLLASGIGTLWDPLPPFMVELFAAGLFNRSPDGHEPSGRAPLRAPGSPRQPELNEPLNTSRTANPSGGFAPTLRMHGPDPQQTDVWGCLCRPGAAWPGAYRIERRDWPEWNQGLLRRASVELDEPLSWHPALRARRISRQGVTLQNLSAVGETAFRGRARPFKDAGTKKASSGVSAPTVTRFGSLLQRKLGRFSNRSRQCPHLTIQEEQEPMAKRVSAQKPQNHCRRRERAKLAAEAVIEEIHEDHRELDGEELIRTICDVFGVPYPPPLKDKAP